MREDDARPVFAAAHMPAKPPVSPPLGVTGAAYATGREPAWGEQRPSKSRCVAKIKNFGEKVPQQKA
jgi:hypothetical protein